MMNADKEAVAYTFKLELPYLLRIPNKLYQLRYGRSHSTIKTESVDKSIGEDSESKGRVMFKVVTGELTEASGADVPGALLRFTRVEICFGMNHAKSAGKHDTTVIARNNALTALNRFLDVYRYIASDKTVRPLSRSEFHQVRGGQSLHIREDRQEGDMGTTSFGTMFDDSEPISMGSVQIIEETKVSELESRLLAGQIPTVSNLLLLNAEGSKTRGENRIAVIDGHAAFDILTESKAIEIIVRTGKTREEAEQMLEFANTLAIWRNHLVPVIDRDILQRTPYQSWDEKWRQLRNRVVHDGHTPSDKEVDEFLSDMNELSKFVQNSI